MNPRLDSLVSLLSRILSEPGARSCSAIASLARRLTARAGLVATAGLLLTAGPHPARAAISPNQAPSFQMPGGSASGGSLRAWGDNASGKLGDGTTTDQLSPKTSGTVTTWVSVAGGLTFSAGLRSDGTLWMWGDNAAGQLGDGTTTTRLSPTQVGTNTNWRSVAAGSDFTVAIRTDGTLWAWGNNAAGQLGDNTTTDRRVPTQVGTNTNWQWVDAGGAHVVAVRNNGTLWAWGDNSSGQLGDGTTTGRRVPTQIGTATNWRMATAGTHDVSGGIKTDGTLWGWGNNANGAVGDGTTTDRRSPVQVGTNTNWQSVDAGGRHMVAVKTDGTLWAWGDNGAGQLGDGTTTDRLTPKQVGTATNWRLAVGAYNFTQALRSDGTLWAFGANNSGKLGDGTTTARTSPVQIGSSTSWRTVAVGKDHTLAVAGPPVVLEDCGPQVFAAFVTSISPGTGTGDAGQTVTFIVTNNNNAMFLVQPTIDASTNATPGALRFTLATNAVGTVVITVFAKDNGGTNSGGVDTSAAQTFTLTVTPVNDPPVIAFGTNTVVVREDAGAVTSNSFAIFSAGPADEVAAPQTVSVLSVSNNNAALFSSPPAINNAGTLTFTSAANVSGTATVTVVVQDNGGTANGGVDKSTNTFTITVLPVNDAPTLAAIENPAAILEDAGQQSIPLSGITAGGGESQTLTVTVTSSNPGLIPTPTVTYTSPNPTGSLSYTPVANASGTAVITVIVTDNGGTANGGVNSVTNTFTVTVTPVNDAPTLAAIPNPAPIPEDAGQQSIPLSGITAGGGENQTLTITVSSSNPGLIPNPSVTYTSPNSTGSLSYTPVPNVSGTATITVVVTDNGGTANGGVNSVTNTFIITVNAVNDAPTATLATNNVVVLEDSGPYTNLTFALFTVGPADEILAPQSVTNVTILSVTNAALFSVQPLLDTNGVLTFTPATNAYGTALVTFVFQDNGGTDNGGVNTVTNTFLITVTPVNDPPTVAAIDNPAAILEDAGQQTIPLSGITAGPGESQGLTVTVTSSNPGLIPDPALIYTSPGTTGSLSYTPVANASGTATITVIVTDDGGTADGGVNSVTNTFTVTVTPVNDAPTLAAIENPAAILEDAGQQSIPLSGITAGGGESQTLTITATSSNPALIPNPTVTYTSPNATGSLSYTPVANANGTVTITVIVSDDGGTANGGVNSVTNTFIVTVTAVNDAPTLATIPNPAPILENAGLQTVPLSGITAGPGESQTLTVTVTSSNPALIPNPTVTYTSPNDSGSLSYTPVASANGTATITVVVTDDGGTAEGGVNSVTNTFTVTVTGVNDAPMATLTTNNVVVLEDSGPFTNLTFTLFTVGPADEILAAQSVTNVTILSVTNAALFSVPPMLDTNGVLTFTPATNAYGTALVTFVFQDNGGTDNGGVNTVTNTFLITVTPVNDPPTVTAIDNPAAILEDAGEQTIPLSGITAGPNESQGLTVTVTSSNPGLIPDPTLTYTSPDPTGSLSYTPVANASGTATITVIVTDDGGTADGGVNSVTNTFTVTVTPVNDAPTLAAIENPAAILEDAGQQTVPLSGITAGGGESQTLTITATSSNPALIPNPTVTYTSPNATGSLSYTPVANANGTVTITVIVTDDGGTANGGVNSVTNTFIVTVTAVNDAPVIAFATNNVVVLEDSGPFSGAHAALSFGPADESDQAFDLLQTANNNPGLFSVAPSVAADGTLTFTPALHANGVATVTVIARDNGGTDNGGVNAATNTFLITVVAVNDAPSIAFATNNVVVLEDACPRVLALATYGVGPANESSQSLINVSTANDNNALFSAQPAVALNGVLSFTPARNANGSATVTVIAQDSGGTANGGVDKTTNSFTITVTPVNDPPSFALPAGTALGPWTATTIAGTVLTTGSADGTGTAALFNQPTGLALDSNGNAYVADRINHTIRRITPAGVVTTVAGLAGVSGSADGVGAAARFKGPVGVAVDAAGNIFVADTENRIIRQISPGGAVTTIAGLAGSGGSADGTATTARFWYPFGITVDRAGNVYVSDPVNYNIRKITTCGVVTTLAGQVGSPGAADGTGLAARFALPYGLGIDQAGMVYVADQANHTIRQITPDGVVTTLAGAAGTAGSADGIGGAARFRKPTAVTADNAGNLYVLDGDNYTVRQIAAGAVVTTLVGTPGMLGSADGVGAAARFVRAYGIAVNPTGTLVISDTYNHTIRRVAPVIGVAVRLTVLEDAGTQTVAGFASSIAAGPANEAAQSVSFLVSNDNNALFSIQPAIAANGTLTYTPAANANGSAVVTVVAQDNGGLADGGMDTSAPKNFLITLGAVNDPPVISFATNNLVVLEDSGAFSGPHVSFSPGPADESGQSITNVVTSNNNPALFSAAPAVALNGTLTFTPAANVSGVATVTVIAQDNGGTVSGGVNKSTNTFTLTVTAVNDAPTITFATANVGVFRNSCRYSAAMATFTTGPANESVQSITGVAVTNNNPTLFAVQPALTAGVLSFTPALHAIGVATVTVVAQDNGGTANGGADKATNTFTITITAINVAPEFLLPAGSAVGPWTATTLAGTPLSTGSADGTGAAARFNNPFGVVVDAAGNLILADRFNHTIRKVTPAGVVTTIAGTAGSAGSADGVGAAARFNLPAGVAIDRAGNLYVADSQNRTLRLITPGGAVTTLAGLAGASGSTDGIGSAARFLYPFGVTVDDDGNAYVSDAGNRTIRKVTPCAVVTTLAGLPGSTGTADGTGAAARFGQPYGVAVDDSGTVFVADQGNHTIRQITPDGVVTTLAGTAGSVGSTDGIGAAARFNKPTGVAVDHSGNVYVLDGDNFTVRQIAPGGVVTTLAGLAGSLGNANGTGTAARFNRPYGIVVGPVGNLRITDTGNHTVRQLTPVQTATPHITISSAAGAQTVAGFITAVAVGPADEAAQTVGFLVTNDNAALFSAAPAIAPDGTLTFTPAPGMSGTAVVTIVAQDNGGTANGGVDTSTPRTLLITVTAP